MQPKHLPAHKETYAKRLILAGCCVTAAFIYVCVSVFMDLSRLDYEKARQAATNVVASVASEIERNLELYDLSLQAVVDGMHNPKVALVDPDIRHLILFDRAATAKHLGSIFILDQSGKVLLDSRQQQSTPDDHVNKDYFRAHMRDTQPERYISQPWIGKNGEHLIAISRPIIDPDGSFQGVVVGTIRLTYFHDIFRKLKLNDKDALFLVRDGTMVMRFPFDIEVIGRDVRSSALTKQMSSAKEGSFNATGSIDGMERLYAYKQANGYPLTIGYGQALGVLYQNLWSEAWRLGLIICLVCFLNIGLVVFLARALKKRGQAEALLAAKATTDSLTGLCNRRRFDEIVEKEWRRAQRTNSFLAVCMIDADEFKAFNDRFGHHAGDDSLRAIATCIDAGTRRGSDLGARYGGEEFVVLLPGQTAAQAFEVADHIRQQVQLIRSNELGQEKKTPTISVGVASVRPQPGLQLSSLLKAADAALYQAKAQGRNRTVAAEAFVLNNRMAA
jgi:diguanylate cyclase (GGDEF)-like protein